MLGERELQEWFDVDGEEIVEGPQRGVVVLVDGDEPADLVCQVEDAEARLERLHGLVNVVSHSVALEELLLAVGEGGSGLLDLVVQAEEGVFEVDRALSDLQQLLGRGQELRVVVLAHPLNLLVLCRDVRGEVGQERIPLSRCRDGAEDRRDRVSPS